MVSYPLWQLIKKVNDRSGLESWGRSFLIVMDILKDI